MMFISKVTSGRCNSTSSSSRRRPPPPRHLFVESTYLGKLLLEKAQDKLFHFLLRYKILRNKVRKNGIVHEGIDSNCVMVYDGTNESFGVLLRVCVN